MVQVPIEDLLGPRVLDWTMVRNDQPALRMSYNPAAGSEGWLAGDDQDVLLRLDGVVYLLGGCPLTARRCVEGPAFRSPSSPEASGSDDWEPTPGQAGRIVGTDNDDEDELATAVATPDKPIVVNVVRRAARLDPNLAQGPATRIAALAEMGPALPSHGAPRGAWSQILGAQAASDIARSGVKHPLDRMDETSDRLCLLDERTGLIVLEIGAEWYLRVVRQARADRVVLPMGSGVNILPNTSAQITARRQNGAFRPERLIIGGTPRDWIVNDVRIGNRSQFSQSGDIPGDMFAASAIDTFVLFEMAQAWMDVVLVVTYIGPDPGGAPFVGAIIGMATLENGAPSRDRKVLAKRSAIRWTPLGRTQGWMLGLGGEDENRDFDPGEPRPAPGVIASPASPASTAEETETKAKEPAALVGHGDDTPPAAFLTRAFALLADEAEQTRRDRTDADDDHSMDPAAMVALDT